MKRFTLVILAFFLLFINTTANAAQKYVQKEIVAQTADNFTMKAMLKYPKVKGKKTYKTVVMLHSLGTDSGWWGPLPEQLLDKGMAVLLIDLRGHGTSIYNSKLLKVSWRNLTNNSYKKYPDDVLSIMNKVKEDFPRMTFFNDWALVGSDIGGSAGIIAADKIDIKPKTIVLLSPVVQSRGLYIPVCIAQLPSTDFLSISSKNDTFSLEAEKYLKKFAQREFATYTSDSKSTGMVLLKNDTSICDIITAWVFQYLHD